MLTSNPDSPEPARKNALIRRSRRHFWIMLGSLSLTLPVFAMLAPIWHVLVGLGTASFMVAALGLGLLLAAGPVAILVSGLMGVFLRVEACFVEPTTQRSVIDKFFICIAALLSYSPAIATLYVPFRGLVTGTLAFRGPGQQYTLKADPYGFWQAEAFWLMGAAALAYLATQYWYSRYQRTRQKAAETT